MVIIDTSVAFKWFDISESNRESAITLLRKHLEGKDKIYIPDLMLYEITNAWSTKTALLVEDIQENLSSLEAYTLNICSVNFKTLTKASHLSKTCKVSVYDAIYAVLAKEKECDLISADAKFVKQVNLPFVRLLE